LSGPLYGGGSLGKGITVKDINTRTDPSTGYIEMEISLLVDRYITDINDIMQRLQNLMKPQPGYSMTTSTASSSQAMIDLDEPEEAPLPDEDLNGNGKFDDDLLAAIEKRFDDVDQALRLLVGE
jgi:hypothetical protein